MTFCYRNTLISRCRLTVFRKSGRKRKKNKQTNKTKQKREKQIHSFKALYFAKSELNLHLCETRAITLTGNENATFQRPDQIST